MAGERPVTQYAVTVTRTTWLTPDTVEVRLTRPSGFDYLPGQKISFFHDSVQRDYTLLGPPDEPELALCVRHIPQGRFSPLLAMAEPGDRFHVSRPFGFFTFKASDRTPVFVATGTGVAPFVAFVRAGVRGFHLLHGVRSRQDLYYEAELANAAERYIPCLSEFSADDPPTDAFTGRVDRCLTERLPDGAYDFYLCGRNDMIREVMLLIDERWDGAYVFTESFF